MKFTFRPTPTNFPRQDACNIFEYKVTAFLTFSIYLLQYLCYRILVIAQVMVTQLIILHIYATRPINIIFQTGRHLGLLTNTRTSIQPTFRSIHFIPPTPSYPRQIVGKYIYPQASKTAPQSRIS